MEGVIMNSERFDSLARSLGTRRDRRSVVKSFGAAALGAAGMIALRGSGAAAPAGKVNICHVTGNGTYNYISVSSNALPAHVAHGDVVTDLNDLANCGACGNACTAPANGTAFCGEDGCDYTCNDGFVLNEAGDACVATSLCPAGYEALNGGCFLIVPDKWDCPPMGCNGYGSIDGSGNYMCGNRTFNSCHVTSDCPTGQACYNGNYCISTCS
jgi:hypothetical protein